MSYTNDLDSCWPCIKSGIHDRTGCDVCLESRLGRIFGRGDRRGGDRDEISSRDMDGWLWKSGTKDVAIGSYFIFWDRDDVVVLWVKFASGSLRCVACQVGSDGPCDSCGSDAERLFSDGMANRFSAFLFYSRFSGRDWDLYPIENVTMKLGLIALSGLRLCDAPLLELGLSFPDVQRRAREIQALPSLGLLTLAGMTPAAIEVEYLEIADLDGDLPDRFDAVALSTLTATAKEAWKLADRFREQGVTVILGGLHATLNPEESAKHVDCVLIGEGESVWPEVMEDLLRGSLRKVYDAREKGPFDLAESPMPRFDLLASDRYPRVTVQTQRGCPLSCEFCGASMRLSPKFRVKPVERVMAEIRYAKQWFQRPFIEFADDNTFADKKHGKELMRALRHEKVRWFTETDLSVADDDELLELMRDAGCHQILIGLESPRAERLDRVEQKSNWKYRRVETYLKSIEKIQRQGITVNGCFIVGMDGDGPECFDGIYEFVKASGLYDVQVTLLTPFPGTPLWQRFLREGRLLDPCATERATLFDINYQPTHLSVEELREGFVDLVSRLYAPEFVRYREGRFREQLRAGVAERRVKVAVG